MKKEWFEPGPDGTRADRRQGMSEINHEAAKNVCNARLAQDMHPSSSDRNIARAYLDLSAQLAAERARVQALARLVPLAFTTGRTFGMNKYELGEHSAFSFYESDFPKELAAILEGRDTQGDDA